MSSGFVRFKVPENFAGVAEVIINHALVFEDTPDGQSADGEEAIPHLEAAAGEFIDLYIHDDEEEPGDPYHDLLAALANEHAPYFGYCNSYTERSRGERALAQISLNADGSKDGEIRKFLDWQHGEPGNHRIETAMTYAEFNQQEIDMAIETFFGPGPTLKP